MLRGMIRRLVNWAQYDDLKLTSTEVVRSNDLLNQTSPNINMTFYVGIGGKVVEFVQYDRKTDERTSKVYVISDDKELDQELTRIISLELMRF